MRLSKYPQIHQTHNGDCGSEVLRSVLLYYGIEKKRGELEKLAGTTKKDGTCIDGMLKVLDIFDLKYDSRQMTLNRLLSYIDRDIPVILSLQAWACTGKEINYTDEWDFGHFVAAIDYKIFTYGKDNNKFRGKKEGKIIFADPYVPHRTTLTFEELVKERWHDMGTDGQKYIRHGIAVFGKEITFNARHVRYME